jgi:transcriptional regulator with XRE-family HTH domain
MSQEKLSEALDLTYQQLHKYESGVNRISASRLHHVSQSLQVPVSFFFEGGPSAAGHDPPPRNSNVGPPADAFHLLETPDGLSLARGFMRINNSRLRRLIVDLVELLADK